MINRGIIDQSGWGNCNLTTQCDEPDFSYLTRMKGDYTTKANTNRSAHLLGGDFGQLQTLPPRQMPSVQENSKKDINNKISRTVVALTQISACSTHKNLAVRKIMEEMGTAYAKTGIQSGHFSNYTWDRRSRKAGDQVLWKESGHRSNISLTRVVWWW